jgi:hypothetical protein
VVIKSACCDCAQAGIGFVIFSSLEDIPADAKEGLPTLHDGRKVTHFESKAAVAVSQCGRRNQHMKCSNATLKI